MNAKPDYKSYILRQISYRRYPWIIKSKEGSIYEELNGYKHNRIKNIIKSIICNLTFLYGSIKIYWHIIYMNDKRWIIIYITFALSVLIILPIIIEIAIGSLIYKKSKFEIIDVEKLEKYPGIKL